MNDMQRSDFDRQAHREALLAIILAAGYFIWWYFSAYGLSAPAGSVKLPELYFGLPLWFLMACVAGPLLFTLLCGLMVKYLYRDLPLDPECYDTRPGTDSD